MHRLNMVDSPLTSSSGFSRASQSRFKGPHSPQTSSSLPLRSAKRRRGLDAVTIAVAISHERLLDMASYPVTTMLPPGTPFIKSG